MPVSLISVFSINAGLVLACSQVANGYFSLLATEQRADVAKLSTRVCDKEEQHVQ